MKKTLLSAAIAAAMLLSWSCEQYEPETIFEATAETSENLIADYDLSDVYYDADSEKWLKPINDPYRLENFQKAYDNLRTGKSSLAKSIIAELPEVQLQPTHYHVKLWPKTENESEELKKIQNIPFSNYPFDVIHIPSEQIKKCRNTTE